MNAAKLKRKTMTAMTVITVPGIVTADNGHTADTMHHGAQMMWSQGAGSTWFAAVFWVSLWILILLGIVYLFQQVTTDNAE